jgi:FAD/FMN-containing dehydrogenase
LEIDVERRIARVRSGTKWDNIVPVASEHGLAALHGSTPDVSVAGYSLGGGLGWYARKLGLSTNSVTAIELVTADGALPGVDHDYEPDVFWALRGGGGNFGIVTALEVQLDSIPDIQAGFLFFPWERSSEVLQEWREWTETVPEEMTSVGRILPFPPIEEIPEPLRSGKFVAVGHLHGRRGDRRRHHAPDPRPRAGDGHLRDGRALIDAHAEAFEPCLNGRGYLNFTEHRTVRRGSTRTPTASCAR